MMILTPEHDDQNFETLTWCSADGFGRFPKVKPADHLTKLVGARSTHIRPKGSRKAAEKFVDEDLLQLHIYF